MTEIPDASPETEERDAPPWRVFGPEGGWTRDDLAELWRYRDLLYFLLWRDIAVRYRQTVLGCLWAILQPLLTMVVFSVFLGHLAGVPSDGVPYPVFSYLGLLPWAYFSGAVMRSAGSVSGHAHLLTRVYFPRVLLPLSAALSALVDFAIAAFVLVGLLTWYGLGVAPTAVLLIPLVLVTAMAAGGVGMGLAALNARYRDVQHAVPFLMQLWMFATPVVYPTSIVPERWHWLFALNPMTGLIEAYRRAVLGAPLDWAALGVSVLAGLLLTGLGLWQFRRVDSVLADMI